MTLSSPDPKILVLGAGSAGSRHARLLSAAGARVAVADPDYERAGAVPGTTPVLFNMDHLDGYDGIVVASPTALHMDHALAGLSTGARLLVEKPLASSGLGIEKLLELADDRVMVGHNLRLHAPVQRLVGLVHEGRAGKVSAVRLWFGSWLPDWRPGTDYRNSYSAHAEMGGGVLLDSIHELDLLLWLLRDRDAEVLAAVMGRFGPLEIDVEDTVKVLLRHSSGVVAEVSLDYLSRRYRRGCEVVGEKATIRLDWARGVVEVEDGSGVLAESADTPIQESYELEAQRFIAFLANGTPPPVDASAGADSVRLADRIRSAAQ